MGHCVVWGTLYYKQPSLSGHLGKLLLLIYNNENLLDSELRSCVKVEVAVLGSPSLISLMVSVDVMQH